MKANLKAKEKFKRKKELPTREATRTGLRSQSVVTEKTDKATVIEEKPKKMLKNIKKEKKEAPKKFLS